jgi:GT2 family glycosyltransferase
MAPPTPQRQTAPLVHAVILNFRTRELTTVAVERLLASDYPTGRLRVWIVDNGSADGSAGLSRFPAARVIASEQH